VQDPVVPGGAHDPADTRGDVAPPDDTTDRAVELMRQCRVRRLPVVEHGGAPAGIVSLGDLVVAEDPHYVLADISKADPNN
jgi:CBS domain-containing protein